MRTDSTVKSIFRKGVRLFVAPVVDLPCPSFTATMTHSASAYSVKIAQFCFSLGFLGLVLFGLRAMMFGSNTKMGMVFGLCLIGATVLRFGGRYWMLSAFCFGFYDTIPYVRFTGAELGCLILCSVFFIRQAVHTDFVSSSRKSFVFAAIPFMAWMCLVWIMNPTGMLMFGSSSIGGRFYFKVILAFFSLLCLSRMRFEERDCKILAYAIAFGYLAFVAKALYFGDISESFLGAASHYRFIHLSFVAPLFLCRFSVPELFARFWPFWGFLITFGLSFYSGNRTAAARPVLVGLIAPFFLKRDQMKTLGLFICALFVVFVMVLGQGLAWRLPYAIQRPLSFLPGKWDRRLEDYGLNDTFRATLRMYAREHIRDSPWFGDGGFSLNSNEVAWTNARNAHGDTFSGHVVARNWHNVWLGMAADFGIPLSVFWGLFMATLLIQGYIWTMHLPSGSWVQTMSLYFYLLILVEFLNSFFNGGHTALTTQQMFIWAGLLTAVRNGVVPISTNTTQQLFVNDQFPKGA